MGIIKKKDIQETGAVVLDAQPLQVAKIDHFSPVTSAESIPKTKDEKEPVTRPKAANEISTRGVEILKSISDIDKVKSEAGKIVLDAEQKSRDILAEAQRKVKEITAKARAQGFENGIKEGRQEVAERLEQALATLNAAVKQRKKIIKDAEAEVLRLSIKIAEQIIRSEVSLHRDVCLNIVSEAIGRVSDREQIILKVSREDLEQVKKYKDRISGLIDGVKSFSILEDSNIEAGGCVIETNLGYIDAKISTKLSIIADALFGVAGSGKK